MKQSERYRFPQPTGRGAAREPLRGPPGARGPGPAPDSPSRRARAGGGAQPRPQSPAKSRLSPPRSRLGTAILSSPCLPSLPLPPAGRRAPRRHFEARLGPPLSPEGRAGGRAGGGCFYPAQHILLFFLNLFIVYFFF